MDHHQSDLSSSITNPPTPSTQMNMATIHVHTKECQLLLVWGPDPLHRGFWHYQSA